MSDGLLLAASVLAVYRMTRLVTVDTISERPRNWLVRRAGRISTKLSYLVSCPFCSGAWLAAGLTIILAAGPGLPLPLLWWPSIAGGQSLLSAADAKLSEH